jgi:hypothetical protein
MSGMGSDECGLDTGETLRVISCGGVPIQRFAAGEPHRREINQDRRAVRVEDPGTGVVKPEQQSGIQDEQRERAA